MEVVYIAGPYRAKTEWELISNIRLAEQCALDAWRIGFAVICPHKNTAHFGGALGLDDSVWINGDLEILRRCDIIWVVGDYEYSVGTNREIIFAKENNIRVVYSLVELNYIKNEEHRKEWDRHHGFPYSTGESHGDD